MNMIAQEQDFETLNIPLRDFFFRWQCRVRQIAMRENEGKPTDGMMPAVTLANSVEPLGHIITIITKTSAYSKTPEMQHLARQTKDPAQRREKALQLLSETYYQKAAEFSDVLTASFPPGSPGAKNIIEAEVCGLVFEAFGQRYDLHCRVGELDRTSELFQATWWHNNLFNPHLPAETMILGFRPDWTKSASVPDVN